MAANQNPPQSMGSTNTVFNREIRFDPSYLKTLPGILKVTAIILNLLGFVCVQSSSFSWHQHGVLFGVVALASLWLSAAALLAYLLHAVERLHRLPWLRAELLLYTLLAFLYLVASTIVVAFGSPAYSAAGFFGYLAMVVYGYEAFLKGRAVWAGQLAQGARVAAKAPHVLTPPVLA